MRVEKRDQQRRFSMFPKHDEFTGQRTNERSHEMESKTRDLDRLSFAIDAT
jgi:hypothetical protein